MSVTPMRKVNAADEGKQPTAFAKVLAALKARCPDYVDEGRWQQAIDDGERFLETWGDQAASLGWTSRDLFCLHTLPTNPHPSYARLSRRTGSNLRWDRVHRAEAMENDHDQ